MPDRGFRWLVAVVALLAAILTPMMAHFAGPSGPAAWRPDGYELILIGVLAAAVVAALMYWARAG